MDDVTLIRQTIEGNPDACGTLVERHQPALHALVSLELGDARAASEVVQTVFAEAYAHLEDFRFTIGFRSWLCEIALHECRSRRKVRGMAMHELDRLPARRRRVLTLRVFADLPFREIARIEGTSVAAAKGAYLRAVAATASPRRLSGWRCRQFRTSLVDLVEGTLEGAARSRLERHLARCAGCSAERDVLRRVPARLRESVPPADPAFFTRQRQEILERIGARGAPGRRRPAPRAPVRMFPRSAVLAAALAIVIAVIGALRLRETFRPAIQIAGGGEPVPNDLAALDDETLLALAEIAAVLAPGSPAAPGIDELSLGDLEALDRWLDALSGNSGGPCGARRLCRLRSSDTPRTPVARRGTRPRRLPGFIHRGAARA